VQVVERRIGLLFAVFLLAIGLGAGRAAWLTVVRADDMRAAAAVQQRSTVAVPARRGTISDTNGSELAVSQPATTIAATPYLIDDPVKRAAQLAPLLRRPEDEVLRALSRRDTGFVYLARRLPARRGEKIRELGIEGLEFIPEYKREYPREWMASQLLGSIGADGQGLGGLEYSLDGVLRGEDGKRSMVKDALGEAIKLRENRKTIPGAEVSLTLDAAIQDRAEAVLAEVGELWQPKGATALVMDPGTGAILALANWPRVNANALTEAPDYARQNRAVGSTYEPGSTYKAFTVAGALEDGKIRPDTQIDLPPTLQIYDREIRESHPRPAARWPVSEILAKSSNVGAVKIGLMQGADAFDGWLRRFGFGRPTGVDLPGEEAGIVIDRDQYSGASMGNLPIGQGMAVTPMQMAAGYAAIANGGILRAPHIVKSIDGRPKPARKGTRILSRATASSVSRMLEGVLDPDGTASMAAIEGYKLAGKTGTAQKPENGGYSDSKYVASFVGFAPARNPKLLVTVMVDEPKGDIYGGVVAAPAFRKITSFALNYLRIPPQ
jgi:cell division protein FtsI (penicillin-binding protein 3)